MGEPSPRKANMSLNIGAMPAADERPWRQCHGCRRNERCYRTQPTNPSAYETQFRIGWLWNGDSWAGIFNQIRSVEQERQFVWLCQTCMAAAVGEALRQEPA